MYLSNVQPKLEYAVQAVSLVQDVEKIEKVQRRAINMVRDLNSRNYEDKFK